MFTNTPGITSGLAFSSATDSDDDGVNDVDDLCPGTPAEELVNANGCSDSQLDADEDGVSDAEDLCAGTAPEADVDENGCSAEQRDTDEDGISDADDNCPENANADQADLDVDGVGDACDTDFNASSAVGSIIERLEAIIDENPGDCADKIEDVNAQAVLAELNAMDPDILAALGTIEGADGDLEAALGEGCSVPSALTDLLDDLTSIARGVAVQGIADAVGVDPDKISEAEASLAEGDAFRAAGQNKDAVSKYKDALAKVS